MTKECWEHQKNRLVDRFGARNISPEFTLLAAIECQPLPDMPLVDMINAMIGGRKPNDPPLLSDFRFARQAYERRQFERDLSGASAVMRDPARFKGLQAFLAKEFPGCKTVNEAVEVRNLQIQIRRANDPSYDPMRDPKWS